MADPWAQFADAPQDEWAQFADAQQEPAAPQQPNAAPNPMALRGGAGEALMSLGTGALAAPIAGLAGIGTAAARGLGLTNAQPADVVERVQGAMTYQPRTAGGQAVTGALAYPFEKLAQGADVAGDFVNRTTGSPALAAGVNTAIQSAPAILLRGRGKAGEVGGGGNVRPARVGSGPAPRAGVPQAQATAAPQRPAGLARVPDAAPTKEALKAASKAAYTRAEKAGAVIKPESFSKAVEVITRKLEREGLDTQLHPDATAALNRLKGESGPVSFEKLDTLRKVASAARKSQKPDDARLAGEIVDIMDRYADTIGRKDLVSGSPVAAKAYKEARNLYSRSRKADTLDDLHERAEITAPNFSGSGKENALRTEYRKLALNPRKMRLFTKEEQAAIKKVAKGGPVENSLRQLGKFAPTGLVSTVGSLGAGFVAGGAPGALLLPAAGGAARFAATRMTMRNAQKANEIVRRGPPPKPTKKRNALAREPS